MGDKFGYGNRVKLVGRDNSFVGEKGMFFGYKNRGLEVYIFSESRIYWFSEDEVERI